MYKELAWGESYVSPVLGALQRLLTEFSQQSLRQASLSTWRLRGVPSLAQGHAQTWEPAGEDPWQGAGKGGSWAQLSLGWRPR